MLQGLRGLRTSCDNLLRFPNAVPLGPRPPGQNRGDDLANLPRRVHVRIQFALLFDCSLWMPFDSVVRQLVSRVVAPGFKSLRLVPQAFHSREGLVGFDPLEALYNISLLLG